MLDGELVIYITRGLDLPSRTVQPPAALEDIEGPDQIGVKISFKDVGVTALS